MKDGTLERINSLSPEKRVLLLEALEEAALETEGSRIVRRSAHHGPIPLSYAQQRLWLLDQLQPGSRAYNEFSAIRMVGSLDIGVLERSLSEIVCRHEALRTTFPMVGGEPVQVIAPERSASLRLVDLSNLPKLERDAEVHRLADEETSHSFDLAQGPLLRLNLLRITEEESILFVGAHHIILDGWSVGIFRRELAELYNAFSAGKPSPLAALPVQYADYAIWQRQGLQKNDLDAHLQYWTRQLSNLPPLMQLPVANRRPELQTFRGARQHFKLGANLTRDLKVLSHHENVTLFMTLLSGFQILLYRYSNQSDLPIGTAVANRNQVEIEKLIGFFVNTLILRGDLRGNPSVRELLQRVSHVAVTAYDHSELPFDFIVEALQPERSSSYSPLFQVFFTLQNTPRQTVELPGLTLNTVEIGSVTAKFDLILSMEDTPEGLQGYWQYSTDLFESDTIRRMTGHFKTLLKAMAANPDQPIVTLPILTARERRHILMEWNQTAAEFPQDKCIHQLFEEQVARTPAAVAVVHADQAISYRELNRRANQVAHRLRGLGITTGALIGVCMERSVEMVMAILGVLKAGGAYVPLDPSYPRERLENMLVDAKVAALLTQQKLVTVLPATTAEVICLDGVASADDPGNPSASVTPDNLAYVIYTSGSTGTPKGVLVSHANLVHSTAARWIYYREPVTSFLLLPSFAFDSSVAGIFWTLTQGGALVLPKGASPVDPRDLCKLVSSHGVSHLLAIPSLYAAILQDAQAGELLSLRTVIVAGEPCPTSVVEDHLRQLEYAALFNEYGPTEGTVWSTVYKCESQPTRTSIPIGRPIANTEVYLLDKHLQPVPIGVPAELHIGGNGVALGYLNHPEVTAEKFISADVSAGRLYKTGDVARYRPDGNLELLGRTDQQLKIRGFRIELGEVEAILLQHPVVREAVVIVREDVEGNRRLIGYVSVNTSRAFSMEALERFVAEKVPTYALPSEIELLDALPRLPNGKVDRAGLPKPQSQRPVVAVPSKDDWSDLERTIAEIWKSILKIEAVGRHDNFLKIGGDSLSIIRVYMRLREITEKSLAITDLFKHPTISSLARFISSESVVGEI